LRLCMASLLSRYPPVSPLPSNGNVVHRAEILSLTLAKSPPEQIRPVRAAARAIFLAFRAGSIILCEPYNPQRTHSWNGFLGEIGSRPAQPQSRPRPFRPLNPLRGTATPGSR